MIHPLTFLTLLLTGAVISLLLARVRPRYTLPATAVTATLVTLLWLPARLQLPLTFTVSAWPAGLSLPEWTWRVDQVSWQLSLGVLILVTAVTLHRGQDQKRPFVAGLPPPPGTLALLFGLAGMVALWADALPTLLAGWTLLGIFFFVALFSSPILRGRPAALWSRLGMAWMPLVFIWLAAATLPQVPRVVGMEMQGWPVLTRSLLLVAALLQISVLPLHWWRPPATALSPRIAALAHTVPAAAGALLWARLQANSDIGLAFALPLTLLGLLGLFAAAYRAWSQRDAPERVAAALVMGQTSLILLAGVWAGPEAVVSEGRVLLLGGGLLLLAVPALKEAAPISRLGPLLAALAMAGMPITAGFRGRALLYGAWQADGRWILILVTAILHLPLFAAALLLVLDDVQAHFERSPTLRQVADAAHTLVPVFGLPAVAGLAGASIVSWSAVLLPIAAGAALTRYSEGAYQIQRLLRAALTPKISATREIRTAARAGTRSLDQAIRQAAAVVEGENGFLWLLLLLVVVWLAR